MILTTTPDNTIVSELTVTYPQGTTYGVFVLIAVIELSGQFNQTQFSCFWKILKCL